MQQLASLDEALHRLESLYTIEKPGALRRALAPTPLLIPLLLDAPAIISGYFPHAPLTLTVAIDPEVLGEETIVATITPSGPPAEAVDQFARFMEVWWIDAADQAQGKLAIVIAYR